MITSTRRGVLKGSLGILFAAVGLDAAGPASASGDRREPTLELFASSLGSSIHGRTHGQPAQPDDHVTAHGRLADRLGGVPIGTFSATGVVVRSPFLGHPSTIEQHVFVLPHGTLIGSGHAIAGAGTFAVTGGTGRYAGARGSYDATLSPHGLGGDGTAHFDFTFTS
jgi:hypothetical protein